MFAFANLCERWRLAGEHGTRPLWHAFSIDSLEPIDPGQACVRSWGQTGKHLLGLSFTGFVKMLWGERRGHGTMGAVQRLPMELPDVATFSF
jgi:hypothetical protein